jgi:Zn-dependent protease with chaperone function
MRKRAHLTGTARALLAVALQVGLYVIVLAMLGIEVLLLIPLLRGLSHQGDVLIVSLFEVLAVGSLPGLLVILFVAFGLRPPQDGPWVSVPVDRAAAPALWTVVEQVARQVGTRAPTELRLAAAANASVAERPRLLGLLPGPRRLTVGLPLLLGLSERELRAVIAHEMGHYARGHTRLGSRVYLGSVSLRMISATLSLMRYSEFRSVPMRALHRLRTLYMAVGYVVFSAYSAFYDHVTFALRRQQELEADASARAGYGTRTTISALRSTYALPTAWEHFTTGFYDPMRRASCVPDDPFAAFAAMIADPAYATRLAELKADPPAPARTPRDSHPALQKRIDALNRSTDPEDSTQDPDIPAISLLTGTQRTVLGRSLGRAVDAAHATRNETVTLVPWQRWLERAAAQRVETRAAELDAPLDEILTRLRRGDRMELEAELAERRGVPEDPSPDAPLLTAALTALVSRYLEATQHPAWRQSWTDPDRLEAANPAARLVRQLAEAAVRNPGTGLRDLRRSIAAAGADAKAPPPAPDDVWSKRLADNASATAGNARTTVTVTPAVNRRLLELELNMRTVRTAVSIIIVGIAVTGSIQIFLHDDIARGSSYTPNYAYTPPYQNPNALLYPTQRSFDLLPTPIYTFHVDPIIPSSVFDGYTSITVHQGDTLTALACRYSTTVADLQQINDMGSSTMLNAGQTLRVPSIGAFFSPLAKC